MPVNLANAIQALLLVTHAENVTELMYDRSASCHVAAPTNPHSGFGTIPRISNRCSAAGVLCIDVNTWV
eukprot:CAMPEP_0180626426 /NCGR_PEP_ID=MMETSP1037_2-20121125/37836_1 /TAXON_ID=632150 /ORGANISM="Azadinium spinosum, Strain 3D9" /LENGTH=68 /DNA_ID=CAMNT_0022646989 /DNA_START=288 /DNA_END=494 /DNA_ORIENTATION=+